ncbi:MAG: DUF4861 family protein [Chitinispirillaceae bacterium]|nr:DUF4861 family protein [Chitinispirillaceae bacterium]
MNKLSLWFSTVMLSGYLVSFADPNGAVLYQNGKRLGYHKVPTTAEHHYFGYLEGPAWENKYSAYRFYVDNGDRNAVDVIGKKNDGAILQHFVDPSVDEHTDYPWGTDILKIGSSMGLGSFRLLNNNSWLNPQLPENLDSLVVTILDSSVQTPKVQVRYHGWNIGNGNKITVSWTITTNVNERPTHCEVAITGNYTGKVVVGMTNHRDNTSNPNRNTIQLTEQQDPPLLATLGKQGGLQEGFADTLLMAIYTEKPFFDSFVKDRTVNYGMVLKPDEQMKVRWSMVYSWAREDNPLFRNSDWKKTLVATTDINAILQKPAPLHISEKPTNLKCNPGAFFSLSGRTVSGIQAQDGSLYKKARGVYILKSGDGIEIAKKRFDGSTR